MVHGPTRREFLRSAAAVSTLAGLETHRLLVGLPEVSALRTRAVGRQHYRVATGDADFAFVAIHCSVGPGRAAPDLQSFITDVLAAAESALGETPLDVAWSIELTEIDPAMRINRNQVRSAIAQRSERSAT